MKVFESKPSKNDYGNWEVFKTKEFLDGDEDTKSMFYIKSVNFNYEYEKEFCFIEKYFPKTKVKDFENKSILDLGCFTGGRLIRWVEKFNFKNGHGIDINPIFKVAGEEFLRKMKPNLLEKLIYIRELVRNYLSMMNLLITFFRLMC